MRLILASSSPRRKDILDLLGIPFEVIPPVIHETPDPDRTTSEEALYWSLQKAKIIASQHDGAIVIASDTLIDDQGRKIGKPQNRLEALQILKSLVGRSHRIYTAIAVILPDGIERTAVEEVKVWMRNIPEPVLVEYVSTDEPLDKAGAYSIQGKGRKLIERIEGDYLAAVGLPLHAVAQILTEAQVFIPVDVEGIYRARYFHNWKFYVP